MHFILILQEQTDLIKICNQLAISRHPTNQAILIGFIAWLALRNPFLDLYKEMGWCRNWKIYPARPCPALWRHNNRREV